MADVFWKSFVEYKKDYRKHSRFLTTSEESCLSLKEEVVWERGVCLLSFTQQLSIRLSLKLSQVASLDKCCNSLPLFCINIFCRSMISTWAVLPQVGQSYPRWNRGSAFTHERGKEVEVMV